MPAKKKCTCGAQAPSEPKTISLEVGKCGKIAAGWLSRQLGKLENVNTPTISVTFGK